MSAVPASLRVPVLIAGGGPVGFTLAALLAGKGIDVLVVEADDGYCTGSRAICVSRRSQDILSWVGAAEALVAKGLPWTGGRSHFRDAEVLHFQMPHAPTQRFAPMVNIQQFHVERLAHEAALRQPGRVQVLWQTRVVGLVQQAGGVRVELALQDGSRQTAEAAWLAACDGGRSTVRELCGLALEGTQYEGRYVIVDVEQATARPVERLAWFDPPSNPGSTLLMHRQPDDVWRIDYQIRDDEDAAAAVLPENVLPRVHGHLQWMGETAPWKPLWISLYNAKCLTLPDYRCGRVFFAGDAAHLVPIFGVRGLNSGLDDAANLAWKLAAVLHGQGAERLLDTYTAERLFATHENMAYGAKSTEFMAPPHAGFQLMREAALRLALENPAVRSLINPRQSVPVNYLRSPLNITPAGVSGVDAGEPAPEALELAGTHLGARFGSGFVLLVFDERPLSADEHALARPGASGLRVLTLPPTEVEAWQHYRAEAGDTLLVRPDGYIAGRWRRPDADAVRAAWRQVLAGGAA